MYALPYQLTVLQGNAPTISERKLAGRFGQNLFSSIAIIELLALII
jgi:hypothetical protein